MSRLGGDTPQHRVKFKEHRVDFVLEQKYVKGVQRWVEQVKAFFDDAQSSSSSSSSSSASGTHAARAALSFQDGANLDDVVETVCLEYAIKLLPNLGHPISEIRTRTADLFVKLASVFDGALTVEGKRVVEKSIAPELHHVHLFIDALFRHIGQSLKVLAVELVSELEGQYLHPDMRVRHVAVTVTTRLIMENQDVFVDHDNLAAVWNIFFLLDLLSSSGRGSRYGSRVARVGLNTRLPVCQALSVLAPIYTCKAKNLTLQIITRLLTLPNQSKREIRQIKRTLACIFENVAVLNSSAGGPPSATSSSTSTSEAAYSVYPVFLSLLTAHHENYYDSLYWAVNVYSQFVLNSVTGNTKGEAMGAVKGGDEKKQTSKRKSLSEHQLPAELTEFFDALISHLRAAPPLTRYGSTLCLHAILGSFPAVLRSRPRLYALIIAGCYDQHRLTSELYATMLRLVARELGLTELEALCSRHFGIAMDEEQEGQGQEVAEVLSAGREGKGAARLEESNSSQISLRELVAKAIALGPNIPPSLLVSFVTNMEFLDKRSKVSMLFLLRHWAARVEVLDAHFVQKLMPYLNSSEPDIQTAVVRIFEALAPALKDLTDHLFKGVATYFRGTLALKEDDRLPLVLKAMSVFPYERFGEAKLDEILDIFIPKLLHRSANVRLGLYNMIRNGSRFWKTIKLQGKAIAVLLVGLGDVDSGCVAAACDALLHVLQCNADGTAKSEEELRNWKHDETNGESVLTMLMQDKKSLSEISHQSIMHRLRIYDRVARVFAKPEFEKRGERKKTMRSGLLTMLKLGERLKFARGVLNSGSFTDLGGRIYNSIESYHHLCISPHWYALLATHLGQTSKSTVPVMLLLPLLSSDDSALRVATCHTIKRGCFRVNRVNHTLLQQLLGELPAILRKSNAEVESGLYLMHILVPFQLKGLNMQFITRFLPVALQHLEKPSASNAVRQACLLFIESCIMSRPNQCAPSFERIRHRLRELLGTTSGSLIPLIGRVYSVLTNLASTAGDEESDEKAFEYFNYLVGDLGLDELLLQGDPLLSSLSKQQLKIVALVTIQALGSMRYVGTAHAIVNAVIGFLHHPDPLFRYESFRAINNQLRLTGKQKASEMVAKWSIVPLQADSECIVRIQFYESVLGTTEPSSLDYRLTLLSPEPSDVVKSNGDDDGRDGVSSARSSGTRLVPPMSPSGMQSKRLSMKEKQEEKGEIQEISRRITLLLREMDSSEPTYVRVPEWRYRVPERVFRKPIVNNEFLDNIQTIVDEELKTPPRDGYDQLVYHLQKMFSIGTTGAAAAVVLANLCKHVEAEQAVKILKIILVQLDSNSSGVDAATNKGCVYGLTVIVKSFMWALPLALSHFAGLGVLREGDIYGLRAVLDTISPNPRVRQSLDPNVLQALNEKLFQVMPDDRINSFCKDVALKVLADLCLLMESSAISDVIKYMFSMLDSVTDPEFHESCGQQLTKLFASLPPNHPMLQTFLRALEDASSPRVSARLRAITTLVVLQDKVDRRTRRINVVRFLCDPVVAVRQQAAQALLDGSLVRILNVPFTNAVKRVTKPFEDKPFESLSDYELLSMLENEPGTLDKRGGVTRESPGELISWFAGLRGPVSTAPLPSGMLAMKAAERRKGRRKGSMEMKDKPSYTVPLQETDPLNVQYRRSHAWFALMDTYGLDRRSADLDEVISDKMRQALDHRRQEHAERVVREHTVVGDDDNSAATAGTSGGGGDVGEGGKDGERLTIALSQLESNQLITSSLHRVSLSAEKRDKCIAELRARLVAQGSFTELVQAVVEEDPNFGDELLAEIMKIVQDLGEVSFDLHHKLHNFTVLVSLLNSYKDLSSKYHYFQKLEKVGIKYMKMSQSLRTSIFQGLQEISLSRVGTGHMPIDSAVVNDKRNRYLEATGNAEQTHTQRKQDFLKLQEKQTAIELLAETLSHVTLVQICLVRELGRLMANGNKNLNDSQLIETLSWFGDLIDDQHRGVRREAREAFVSVAAARIDMLPASAVTGTHDSESATEESKETKTDPDAEEDEKHAAMLTVDNSALVRHVDAQLLKGFTALSQRDSRVLHRKKADVISLIGHLAPCSREMKLRQQLVPLLISMWDDGDAEVRKTSISLVKYLFDAKFPELQPFLHHASKSKSPILMQEILKRVKAPAYLEKIALSQLVEHLFA